MGYYELLWVTRRGELVTRLVSDFLTTDGHRWTRIRGSCGVGNAGRQWARSRARMEVSDFEFELVFILVFWGEL